MIVHYDPKDIRNTLIKAISEQIDNKQPKNWAQCDKVDPKNTEKHPIYALKLFFVPDRLDTNSGFSDFFISMLNGSNLVKYVVIDIYEYM